ncbi:sensor histidine kinase [Pseudotabrizicola formosa]|uniref:sensor histidine kinase n=1 Tax=Pseudotabrizicola formosa TaxID=2030009 RepID=UPI00143D19DF|nr:HWE histidine kinase domain-containing protein [Pseudotabrizicola formosa]
MAADQSVHASAPVFLTDGQALSEGLRLGGAGVWRWKIDSNALEWTQNLEAVHALPAGSFDGTLASFQNDLHPDDAQAVWQVIKASVDTGKPYRTVYRCAPRAEAPDIWIEASGGVVTAPDGTRYLTGICYDATARIKNEHLLKRRLAQQSAVASFGSFALNEPDLQKVMDRAVQIATDVLKVPLTKILQFSDTADHLVLRSGIGWREGLVGHGKVGIERESQAGYTLIADGPVLVTDLRSETRFDGPQLLHDHGVVSGISVIIPGSGLRPFGVFGIHARELRDFDLTDADFLLSLANIVAGAARQVAAMTHQSLLVREMAHRAGNMLQLVNSIAGQTLNNAADPKTARHSFSERLSALARSNYIVSRGGWSSTRFAELVTEALKPFGDRIVSSGRDVLLHPDLCFDMGLVLHELATNSMKYGTLGRAEGVIRVSWSYRVDSEGTRMFSFDWSDPGSSAPAVSQGTGFGSKMVRALIEQKWHGGITIGSAPHFNIRLDIPYPDEGKTAAPETRV